MNSLFRLVETNFRFSRKSIVLFSALLKILKIESKSLFKRNLVSARGSFRWQKLIFSIFQIFLLVRGIFVSRERILNEFVWWRRIFYMVETNFCLVETVFPNLIFFSASGNQWKQICLGKTLFPQKGISRWIEPVSFYSVLLSYKCKPSLKLTETSSLYFL